MNRRSFLAVALVLFAALAVVTLSLSATALASAHLRTIPVIDPPTSRFTPIDGLLEGLPPHLRATFNATAHSPHAPYAAPDVRLGKWAPGNQTRPGGVVVYSVYFDNVGDADALNTIITDTLPAQTTYAGDSSGFTVNSAGDIVTWTLGTLPARMSGAFNVTLNVDAAASIGSPLADNCARIQLCHQRR